MRTDNNTLSEKRMLIPRMPVNDALAKYAFMSVSEEYQRIGHQDRLVSRLRCKVTL